MNSNCHERGLTFIELLVTISIVAILAALAVPAFSQLLQNNRAQAQAGLLFHALNYARSEAIHRGVEVRVTALSGTTNWAQGWRVWADTINKNGAYDAGEELQNQDALTGTPTLTGSVAEERFSGSGFINDGSALFTNAHTYLYTMGSTSYCTTVAHAGRVSFEKKATCP